MSNKEVIVKGCKSSHSGRVIEGSPDTDYSFSPVARIGDKHSCPFHGTTPIVSTPQEIYYVNDKLVAVHGAKAACGATIFGCKGATVVV